MRKFWSLIGVCLATYSAQAEDLCPKYGDCVPAEKFDCQDIDRSSFVTRVCYDAADAYMIIRLNQTDYHYCAIDPATVAALLSADSMGSFYNQNIKSKGGDGPFDCRSHPVPKL